MKTAWLMGLTLACGPLGAQQTCDIRQFPLSAPDSRFQDLGDGSVTDLQTHLTWLRCSAGQTWAGADCQGHASSLTWHLAQAAADEVNASAAFFYKDWRLPQLRELATLAERECANPRINLNFFPGTPAAYYWAASTRQNKGADGFAFALSFGAEGVRYDDQQQAHHVRLVRSAQ